MSSINIKRLSTLTVFRIIFTGMLIGTIPIGLLYGIFAVFGSETIIINGYAIVGLKGLLLAPVLAVCLTIPVALYFGAITAFGLWLYSHIKSFKLFYIQPNDLNDNKQNSL